MIYLGARPRSVEANMMRKTPRKRVLESRCETLKQSVSAKAKALVLIGGVNCPSFDGGLRELHGHQMLP